MPKAMEKQLKKAAKKKGLKGKRARAYIYGTMRKAGWRPKREKRKSEQREDVRYTIE